MKFLKEYSSFESVNSASAKFDRVGILTHISVTGEDVIPGVKTEELKFSLWVVLENQYGDAGAFLLNENHKVANPFSSQEIAQLKEQAKVKASNKLNWAIGIGVLLIPILITIGYLISAYNK